MTLTGRPIVFKLSQTISSSSRFVCIWKDPTQVADHLLIVNLLLHVHIP